MPLSLLDLRMNAGNCWGNVYPGVVVVVGGRGEGVTYDGQHPIRGIALARDLELNAGCLRHSERV